ncbi:MAG: ATP-binding protein [Candidatus Muiribacterium halophilum]|uniref:ATP-binding protein n=1 Tax=Muiribacterium halophilum TaxID=2053465 RepID=A0A2N5ZFT8_MUIH1|nr:MAG: ATP-binding protein [Candidatus Muirbacterium halophilum]
MNKIVVKNISKSFKLKNKRFYDIGKETIKKEILKDISFEVNHGEIIGIIGPNGSGKTTLLKIISNLLLPDSGNIDIKGKISPMLDIGIGFHPELTGRENISLFCALNGQNEPDVKRFEQMIEFSGLSEETISQKFKYYSSGMKVRLGFSTIAFLKPEIVLLDEINAVGDISFQEKTRDKIRQLAKNSGIMLVVSHDVNFVKDLCTRAIAITDGYVLADDKPEIVSYKYLNYMREHKDEKI